FASGSRRLLPLGLGRKSPASPSRVRVGLVPADVAHRLVLAHRLPDAESPALPATARAPPEQRMLELLRLSECPALGGPVLSIRVTAVLHEGEELAVGDRKAVDEEGGHLGPMPWTLVVVGPRLVGAHLEGPSRDVDLPRENGTPRQRHLGGG